MMALIKQSILVINTGSSSVKFQLFLQNPTLPLLAKGVINHSETHPFFSATIERDELHPPEIITEEITNQYTHETAIRHIIDWIQSQKKSWQINVVAHRVVHGGAEFKKSVLITPEIIAKLSTFIPLAPLHQPQNLVAIKIIDTIMPNIIQIACFDTAFHANHDPLFNDYALPRAIREKGIRRYGFHGLSYEWIVYSLQKSEPQLASGRLIAAHLGNGASLCAINHGQSLDTTMGMTALDGLPMGTRCGNLDPGAVIYMIRELGLSVDETESILYNDSGLLGLSEWTNDVSLLQGSNNPKAQFALNFFCMRAAQLMGMMAVALGGIDGIVFTGGIGEHSSIVQNKILHHLEFLKPFETRTIVANEERIMAMHSLSLLEQPKG